MIMTGHARLRDLTCVKLCQIDHQPACDIKGCAGAFPLALSASTCVERIAYNVHCFVLSAMIYVDQITYVVKLWRAFPHHHNSE